MFIRRHLINDIIGHLYGTLELYRQNTHDRSMDSSCWRKIIGKPHSGAKLDREGNKLNVRFDEAELDIEH